MQDIDNAYKPSHLGLCVSDLNSSIRFYCEGLGFVEENRYHLTRQIAEVDPPVDVTAQFIRLGALEIELLHYASPGVFGTPVDRRNHLGLTTHLSFVVDDVEARALELEAVGGVILQDTRNDTSDPESERILFVADPDGTRVELMSISPRSSFLEIILSAMTRTREAPYRRHPQVGHMSAFTWLVATAAVLGSVLFPPWSGSAAAAAANPAVTPKYAVGTVTETFVDPHRSTPAWAGTAELPSRTLVTTILYPASGSTDGSVRTGATPDKSAGPFPLIVFAHGLGGTPEGYINVLAAWASEGFVVAAALFPLSNANVPGGPDAGDVVNQPEDMSYVIGAVLSDSREPSGTLSGLVDPKEIGAAGHSNGAVTTLGLVANTCCDDSRVKAAVVMAGTTEGFPPGHYEFSEAPPLLLVHGTADQLIPYRSAPLIYNEARGPKGLLTLEGGSHDAAGGQDHRSASAVIRTTTDFFEAYITGSQSARSRLSADGRSPTTRIVLSLTPGSRGAAIAVPPIPVVHLRASVLPDHNLTSGEAVTVRWSGYTAGKVINILECSNVEISTGSSAGCDFANAGLLHPDPSGHGHFTMHINTGQVGNGTCDSNHPCYLAVNNASSLSAADTKILKITFAPAEG